MSVKISYSCGRVQMKYGDKEALRISKEAGFDGVDLDMPCYGYGKLPKVFDMPHDDMVAHFKDLKAYADEIGIEIPTVHGLCYPYCQDEEINEQRKNASMKHIEAASVLGAKYCVIHSASTVIWGYDATMDFMHEINQRMYNDLIETAEKFGVCLTLESFGGIKVNGVPGYDHFADPEAMKYEYDSLNTEYKAFCLDSGHTNVAVGGGFLPVEDYARLFGDRIKMLHFHDNHGSYDQHLIPGQGNVNWPKVFEALDEIGYDGYYNYEIALKFGDCLDKAVHFLGAYLREFTEKKGKL